MCKIQLGNEFCGSFSQVAFKPPKKNNMFISEIIFSHIFQKSGLKKKIMSIAKLNNKL